MTRLKSKQLYEIKQKLTKNISTKVNDYWIVDLREIFFLIKYFFLLLNAFLIYFNKIQKYILDK